MTILRVYLSLKVTLRVMVLSEYNQRLSENRAAAVENYLIENGIDKNRLESIGYGETKPVYENDTRSGRAKNRRVVFKCMN